MDQFTDRDGQLRTKRVRDVHASVGSDILKKRERLNKHLNAFNSNGTRLTLDLTRLGQGGLVTYLRGKVLGATVVGTYDFEESVHGDAYNTISVINGFIRNKVATIPALIYDSVIVPTRLRTRLHRDRVQCFTRVDLFGYHNNSGRKSLITSVTLNASPARTRAARLARQSNLPGLNYEEKITLMTFDELARTSEQEAIGGEQDSLDLLHVTSGEVAHLFQGVKFSHAEVNVLFVLEPASRGTTQVVMGMMTKSLRKRINQFLFSGKDICGMQAADQRKFMRDHELKGLAKFIDIPESADNTRCFIRCLWMHKQFLTTGKYPRRISNQLEGEVSVFYHTIKDEFPHLSVTPVPLEHVSAYEKAVGFRIHILSFDHNFKPLFLGSHENIDDLCVLLHFESKTPNLPDHVVNISPSSLKLLFTAQQDDYCYTCGSPFKINKKRHPCELNVNRYLHEYPNNTGDIRTVLQAELEERCWSCHCIHPDIPPHIYQERTKRKGWRSCLMCNRILSRSCMQAHIHQNMCAYNQSCEKCHMPMTSPQTHQCPKFDKSGDSRCKKCYVDTREEANHRCLLPNLSAQDLLVHQVETRGPLYAFDFETTQDEQDDQRHVVNLAVAMEIGYPEARVFKTLDEFCRWMFSLRGVTLIAHNGRAFDFQFILRWAVDHPTEVGVKPNMITSGNKLLRVQWEFPMITSSGKIKFAKKKSDRANHTVTLLDSINFFPMPLRKLPKTFGFSDCVKGYFPHKSNSERKENRLDLARGEFPPVACFGPHPDADFLEWHAEQVALYSDLQLTYDQDKELLRYCIDDVRVLAKAVESFCDLAGSVTGLNPWSFPTIASFCHATWRHKFAPPIRLLHHSENEFIRRAFFGGRTETFKYKVELTQQQIDEGYTIQDYDVTSLYPATQISNQYPRHPPSWLTDHSLITELILSRTFFGFVSVELWWPDDLPMLYAPLFGEKKDGKLVFDLLPKKNYIVSHAELYKGIDLGYKFKVDGDALHFDPTKTTDAVFKSYIETFFKIKDKASVDGNEGLRAVAKYCLNNLWGKTAQNPDQESRELITTFGQLNDLMQRDDIYITNMMPLSADCFRISYRKKDLSMERESQSVTHMALGALTTSYARLHLYRYIEALGENLIYCDTDSVAFIQPPGEPLLPLGDQIGELTDEFVKEKAQHGPAIAFVSTGPKSYCYKFADGHEVKRAKGIRRSDQDYITFETMNNAVLYNESVEVPISFQIKQGGKGQHPFDLKTVEGTTKIFRYSPNQKRLRLAETETPFLIDSHPFTS